MAPRGHRLRIGRVSERGRIYSITTVTQGRVPLFVDWRVGRLVVEALRMEESEVRTLAYVVMPDHLHWLIELRSDSLPRVVRHVKAGSGRRIHRATVHRGRVWQAGYHDRALRAEDDVVGVARYIVANPLRAGLVRKLGDYPLWDAAWL